MKQQKKGIQINGIRISDTGVKLLLGDILFYIAGQVLILIFAKKKLYVSTGFLIGVLLSVYMTIDMTIASMKVVHYNEHSAVKRMRIMSVLRDFVVFAGLVFVGVTRIGDILAAVAGIFALKLSAYGNVLIEKLFFADRDKNAESELENELKNDGNS